MKPGFLVFFLQALLCLRSPSFAADTIHPAFQGSFGGSSASSGVHQISASGPQLAAGAFLSGIHTIQNGFWTFLLGTTASSVTIEPGQGASATLSAPAGTVTLEIPADAIPPGSSVTLQLPGAVPSVGTLDLQSPPTDIVAEIISPAQPRKNATLTLSYANADVTGTNPQEFIVARFSDEDQVWVPLQSRVNTTNKTVASDINHFSIFKVFQSRPAGALGNVKVFPNPLRPRLGHTQFTFTTLPSDATLKVYTILGELLAEFDADSAGMASWNGKNRSGTSVASGVYLVYMKSGKNSKVIKIAIER